MKFDLRRRNSNLVWQSVLLRLVAGCTIIWTLPLQAEQGGLQIETSTLPTGMEMSPYSAELGAVSGSLPYFWFIMGEKYEEHSQANSFSAVGIAQGWHADDESWAYDLPFEFPFFGNTRTRVYINSNGTINFDEPFNQYWPDFVTFKSREMIAPMWEDLTTYSPDDIRIQEGVNNVIIYFDASYYWGDKVNVSATLHKSGRIELKYGAGNVYGGMVGISAGDGESYLLSNMSDTGSMEHVDDILFAPLGGLPEGLSMTATGWISGTPILAGTYPVAFIVIDNDGDMASKILDVIIEPNPNSRPVIDSTSPPEGVVTMDENSSQAFSVTAHDPEDEPLTYHWTWNGQDVGDGSDSYTHFAPWATMGRHQLYCYVSDDLWTNHVYAAWQVDVEAVPIEVTTAELPQGMEMVPYSATLGATNGLDLVWSVMPQVIGWGGNWDGQCDAPPDLRDATAVAAGTYHSLALKADGSVVAWGTDWSGQASVPFGLSGVLAIAAGDSHSLALSPNGTVVAWGANWNGQCDLPTGLSNVIAISAGANHSLALRADGTVVAWGAGTTDTGDWPHFGQSAVPTGLDNVVAIEAGESHSLAVRADGTVVAWGAGVDADDVWDWPHYGQSAVPTDLDGVVAIAASANSSVALKSDGTLVVWGANWGNLAPPPGLEDIQSISGGGQHYVALRSNGTIVAWGDNWNGQIDVPESLSDVVKVAAGGYHSLVLRSAASQLPADLTLSSQGTISGAPILAGTYTPTFMVRNSSGSIAYKELEIVIEPNPNTRPVIDATEPTEGAVSMDEASSQSFSVTAHDPEGMPLTYHWTLNGEPVGDGTASYTHVTDWGDAGFYNLRCYMSDDLWDRIMYAQWVVTVTDDNNGNGIPNWMELELGRDPNDADASTEPSSVAGTVHSDGIVIPGATVSFRGSNGHLFQTVTADENGSYIAFNLIPGTYFARINATGFAAIWNVSANHRDAAIGFVIEPASEMRNVDWQLLPGQSPALVTVTSEPAGATVYLDYHPYGTNTPATINVGEVGAWDWAGYRVASHVISLKKVGYAQPSPRVVAAAEAETVSIHFDFASSATGAISIATIPEGAEVYVDYADVAVGVTPIVVSNLSDDWHTVLIRKDGYLQPPPLDVRVFENDVTEVLVELDPIGAANHLRADIRSVPAGVSVYIDYLPSGHVTDVVVDSMMHETRLHSADYTAYFTAHTIMLKRAGALPMAPRYIPGITNDTRMMLVHLSVDPNGTTDSNGDGIPDWLWEQHGYDPINPPDVDSIADTSGMTFGDKLRAGLIPGDPNSRFQMGDVEIADDPGTGQTITFVFDTVPGRRYVVQAREKLTDGAWTNISTVITATAYQTVFTAQLPDETGNQFYRLIVLTP